MELRYEEKKPKPELKAHVTTSSNIRFPIVPIQLVAHIEPRQAQIKIRVTRLV